MPQPLVTDIPSLAIITVPHTGTHFVMAFLELLGLPHEGGRYYDHHHVGPEITEHQKMLFDACLDKKCIVTARDPILCGIRYMTNGSAVSQAADTWDMFLEILTWRDDAFILDIGCREKDRIQHLCDLTRYVDRDPDEYMDAIVEYAEVWKPLNVTSNSEKQRYLEQGVLPEKQILNIHRKLVPRRETVETTLTKEIDWSAFDDAVAWYKSLPTNDA